MKSRIPRSYEGRAVRTIQLSCAECADPFLVMANLAHRYSTCSPACTSLRRSAQKVALTCLWCDDAFWVLPGHARRNKTFCSNPCRLQALNAIERQRQDPADAARRLTPKGYIRIWDGERYVMEHRWVMEREVGRPLTLEERIHHRDSDRANNAPSNLVLCANQGEHLRVWHPDLVHNLPGR